MSFSLLLATYGTVFVAELVGDKNLYTISTLTVRFQLLPVMCGIALAFSGKMMAAVLLGRAIAELPSALVTGMSAATFFATGLIIWMKKSEDAPHESAASQRWSSAVPVSFAAIFFSEWGDVGQLAAATLAARYHAPLTVWVGATLALLTKGILALTLGAGLCRRLPRPVLRYGALGLCLMMGILSLLRIEV
ncbi:MAG TPA: TMEM165/GDT1 family protein [Pyrinomonadaceae bacterium]|jgi:putative Ca2+/H+ antiporter (TMEM165/GDT1 family)